MKYRNYRDQPSLLESGFETVGSLQEIAEMRLTKIRRSLIA